MLELTILKELNLIKQMNQKNVIFVTIGVFQMKLLYVDSEHNWTINQYNQKLFISVQTENNKNKTQNVFIYFN